MTRVDADLLIPGEGAPIANASVVFDGPTITYVGATSAAPEAPDVVQVPVVMPGLWDCHGHFMGVRTLDLADAVRVPVEVRAARAAKDAERVLQAGFTSIREAGGLGVHLAHVIDEGLLAGPAIYGPGAILSTTGGHGDLHSLPLPWVMDACERGTDFELCDGVPECLRAVRKQLRMGARVIKICASGGVLSEIDDPIHQQFSDDELRAIVEEAGRADRVVMAHCHGKPGIMAALRAGCHTIEHGTFLDEEAAAAMREQGAVLVPTRFIVERMLAAKDQVPDYAWPKLVAIADRHRDAIALAYEAGVKIALGTDIATSGPTTVDPWGDNGEELEHLVMAGLSPLDAIAAGTSVAPSTLGPQAPLSGRLAEGYDADVIAVAANPLDDIAVLGRPHQVTHVWKAGHQVKG